jgi:hypothetical protein
MIIYRFRLTSEELEDFVREIEIQPTQTFLDFHEMILSCSELESCQNAFFYTTDKKYKKHQEISFKQKKKKIRKYDDELDEIVTEEMVLHLMKNSRLNAFIEDPHQKMIYEYLGKDFFSFNLELFKIIKSEESVFLPRCVKSTGELPKKIDISLEPVMAVPEGEEVFLPSLIPGVKESIFAGIQENDSELSDIENHLHEILEGGEQEVRSDVTNESEMDENDEFGAGEDVQIDSIEDFDDIEKLEMNHRKFDGDSDDF